MRHILGICAFILLLSRAGAGQPNFVVINLDDTRFDGVDLMGAVLQPQFLGEGALFVESFVPSPLCAPSRASILTGLYASRHGTHQFVTGGANTFRERGSDLQTWPCGSTPPATKRASSANT